MAKIPVFAHFGNSNADGFSSLTNVSTADYSRWTGQAALPATFPYDVSIPGVRMWTNKLPFGSSNPVVCTATTDTRLTCAVPGTVTVNSWVYIRNATVGQGQIRKITAVDGGFAFVDVTPAFSPTPSATCTAEFLPTSHTLDAGSTTSKIIKTAGGTPNFGVNAYAGKWVVIISGAAAGSGSRIISNTATELTLDSVVSPALPLTAGDGFRIMDGAGSVDGLSTLLFANGSLRDMRFAFDNATSFSDGHLYTNYKAFPFAAPSSYKALFRINCLPELMWQLRQRYDTGIVGVGMGVGGATASPKYLGPTPTVATYSYAHDIQHLDFHPVATTGFYRVLKDQLLFTKQAIEAEGNTMDLRGFFCQLAEVDADNADRAKAFENNIELIRDALRKLSDDNNLSTTKGARIPFILTDCGSSSWSQMATVNDAAARIVANDTYSGLVTVGDLTYEGDKIHIKGNGLVELGRRFYTKWAEIDSRERAASAKLANLPTLASLRTRVLRRYERNVTSNATTNATLDMLINDSLREITNTLGDNPWFARRVETLSVTGSYPATATLPCIVKRILRIENQNCPGMPVVYHGISYDTEGRITLALHDYSGGPYRVHFLAPHIDLVKDDDFTIVPQDHTELIVMLTCKRLAESVGNASMSAYYMSETESLWRSLKKDALRFDRYRNASMTTQLGYDSTRGGPANDFISGMN